MISNFFRTARHAPDELSERIDSDARSEHDLIARANWVKINRERIDKLVKESPTAYDLDAAHYWLYQMCGQLDTQAVESLREKMILSFSLDLLELDDTRGYFRTMSHRLRGVDILCEDWEATVNIATGQHLNIPTGRCLDLMRERLRKVRLPRRDWEATVGSARREGNITYGVLLDPPYPYEAGRKGKMYVRDDAGAVSDAAFQWACWHGDDPQFRIAFCGFAGSYKWPDGWTEVPWSSPKCSPGNEGRERIWFSPHCLNVEPNQGAA
jgi:hypothetical protein